MWVFSGVAVCTPPGNCINWLANIFRSTLPSPGSGVPVARHESDFWLAHHGGQTEYNEHVEAQELECREQRRPLHSLHWKFGGH
jgi:hypothetical protein